MVPTKREQQSPERVRARSKKERKGAARGSTTRHPSAPRKAVCPRDCDVMMGKGPGFVNYPGNVSFQANIDDTYAEYNATQSKKERASIKERIIASVRDFGGRFLDYDKAAGVWFEVSNKVAGEKITMAYRNRRRTVPEEYCGCTAGSRTTTVAATPTRLEALAPAPDDPKPSTYNAQAGGGRGGLLPAGSSTVYSGAVAAEQLQQENQQQQQQQPQQQKQQHQLDVATRQAQLPLQPAIFDFQSTTVAFFLLELQQQYQRQQQQQRQQKQHQQEQKQYRPVIMAEYGENPARNSTLGNHASACVGKASNGTEQARPSTTEQRQYQCPSGRQKDRHRLEQQRQKEQVQAQVLENQENKEKQEKHEEEEPPEEFIASVMDFFSSE